MPAQSPFPYSRDNKRYHTLTFHLNKLFPRRVFKAAVDAGLTCPNLDGTKGTGGCSYCLGGGGEFTRGEFSVARQLQEELARIRKRWLQAEVVAYFQCHTNTYAPLETLQELYESALAVDGVCGLSIATRADVLEDATLDYLAVLSRRTYLTVELGLQTVHDRTAQAINRGHTYGEFLEAYGRLKERGIRVCVHLINGLPEETPAMMVESARAVGALAPDAVKLHLLHILRGTAMARQYADGGVTPMTLDGYIAVVCAQLELLPPETVIERLTGDGSRQNLIAPLWSLNKRAVLAGIDRELARQDIWQGKQLARM